MRAKREQTERGPNKKWPARPSATHSMSVGIYTSKGDDFSHRSQDRKRQGSWSGHKGTLKMRSAMILQNNGQSRG